MHAYNFEVKGISAANLCHLMCLMVGLISMSNF